MYKKGTVKMYVQETSFQYICESNYCNRDVDVDGSERLLEIHWTNSLIVIHLWYCHA